MRKQLVLLFIVVLGLGLLWPNLAFAKVLPSPSPSPTPVATATPAPPIDITQKSAESVGPLEKLLRNQKVGPTWPFNPVKTAIRGATAAGVPANTIVLLLLLPIVAFVIAFTRNVIGVRGFGIFLPAALSVVFVATGPIVGIGLFLVIVIVSTATE